MKPLHKNSIGHCWVCDQEATLLTAFDDTVTGYICVSCEPQNYYIHRLLEHIPGIRHPKRFATDGQDQ